MTLIGAYIGDEVDPLSVPRELELFINRSNERGGVILERRIEGGWLCRFDLGVGFVWESLREPREGRVDWEYRYNVDPEEPWEEPGVLIGTLEQIEESLREVDEDAGVEDDEGPMCPGCGMVAASDRQESRPHLCRWCGYDHEKGEVAGLSPA